MKQQSEDYGLALQAAYENWDNIYKNGCFDPLWEDGVNLNLVRNHIMYYRRQLEEHPTLFGFPDIYYKELPPEVNSEYMARSDEIRTAAKISLNLYKADPNYLYILRHYEDFTPKTRNKLFVDNIIGYATGLEQAIKNDKLVDMRRHVRPERYLESFESCAQTMQNTPSEPIQASLFSLFDGFSENTNEDDFDEELFDEAENDDEMEM